MYEFLLVGGVVIWIAVLIVYVRSGLASVFHPATFYMFFHGFIFVFRPIIAYLSDYQLVYQIYSFVPTWEAKITALLVANLGFICFMAAVLRIGRTPLVLAPTAGQRIDRQRDFRGSLLIAAIVLAPLGIYSLRYIFQTDGEGVVGMVYDAATGVTISTTGNGYLLTASDILGALAVLIAWQFRFRLPALVPFAIYFALRASLGGMRWTFLLTSAALALLWLYDKRRNWPSLPILAGAIAMLMGFSVLGQQRDIIRAYLSGGQIHQNLFQDRALEGMDFANLEYLEFQTWAIPEKTGTWGYFLDNLQVLTEPIPRVLWKNKPIGAPIQMWDLYRYGTPIGMSNSLPGEGWDQLGYIGVAIWCGLWGCLFGLVYNWFARSKQTGFIVGMYMLLLPMTVQIYRDGVLLSALKFPMWFIFTVIVWMIMAKIVARAAPRLTTGLPAPTAMR